MRVVPLLALIFALTACVSQPRYVAPNGVGAQLSLKATADFDTVWQSIVETFAQSTTAIETIEKASGFVAAARPIDFAQVADLDALVDFGVLNGVWASSHVKANADRCSARVRYNIFVVQGGTEQDVRVNTAWTGHADISGTNAGGGPVLYRVPLVGNSTGAFERQLLDAIAAKLKGAKAETQVTQQFKLSTFEKEPRNYGQTREDDGWVNHGPRR